MAGNQVIIIGLLVRETKELLPGITRKIDQEDLSGLYARTRLPASQSQGYTWKVGGKHTINPKKIINLLCF